MTHASHPTLPAGTAYVPELDAFRAFAILSVLCLHWLPATSLLNRVQDQTTNGVHLFFVLSGFLITRILLQSRRAMDAGFATVGHSLRQFYTRRALRIFPLYYLVLIAAAALAFPGVRAGFWWHAAYLSNARYFYHHGQFDGPASVFWTLSVEEQFYLLWPLAILLVPRRAMIPSVALTAGVGTAIRVVAIDRNPTVELLTPACANFLAAGALIAVVNHPTYGSPRAARRLRWVFGVATCGLLALEAGLVAAHGWTYLAHAAAVRAINQVVLSMAYATVFARSARGLPGPIGSALRLPPLTYLGRISYGLYVYHQFVTIALERLTHSRLSEHLGHGWAVTAAGHFGVRFAATVAVATASWFLVERPMNALKRYFPYARSPRPAPVDPPPPATAQPESALVG